MIRTLVGIVVGALLATPAGAQTDHLECFKVKDSTRKATYTTGIGGLAPARGCLIKVPAKLMCVPAAQPAMTPSPPGSTNGADAGAFLCYKVRCRRNALAATTVTDEFGRRLVRPRRSRLLCAPLAGSSTTTTTLLAEEVSSTTTTSVTVTTTTSAHKASTTSTTTDHTTTTARTSSSTTTVRTSSSTTTIPGAHCNVPATTCGSCGDGACQPIRPSGELICAYQTQGFCDGSCQSTADCIDGRFCVGASGNAGKCCTPCS